MEFQPYVFDSEYETEVFEPMIKLDSDEYLFKPIINPNPCKYYNIYDSKSFPVVVKSLTGKELNIEVYSYTKVKELKMAIQKADDVLCDQQRIIFKGKELHDEFTMKFYNINSGDLIHLRLSLRGGMFHETSSRKDHQLLACEPTSKLEVKLMLYEDIENEIALLEEKMKKMKNYT
jgi:ubiquitin-like protein Nedd8